jgi:hypothetical protein
VVTMGGNDIIHRAWELVPGTPEHTLVLKQKKIREDLKNGRDITALSGVLDLYEYASANNWPPDVYMRGVSGELGDKINERAKYYTSLPVKPSGISLACGLKGAYKLICAGTTFPDSEFARSCRDAARKYLQNGLTEIKLGFEPVEREYLRNEKEKIGKPKS